jgi:hypothetical protein
VAGEAIDSWFEAISRGLELLVGQTLSLLGISSRRRAALILRPTTAELESLVEGTGVAGPALLSMTLSHYDGTATEIESHTGLITNSFPFGLRAGSRHCPECLAETQGCWQLHWRLGWSAETENLQSK